MAKWDYILVQRVMQAEWDGVPKPAATSTEPLVANLLAQSKRAVRSVKPADIIERFRASDGPGTSLVADLLENLVAQLLDSTTGPRSLRDKRQLVTDCTEALNHVEADNECIDSVERDWLMSFFREIGRQHEIDGVDDCVDQVRDW